MKLKDIILSINAQKQIVEKDSKLEYSLSKKNGKYYNILLNKEGGYVDKLGDKKIDLALINPDTKAILYDDKGNLCFDKDGTKEIKRFDRELLEQEEEFDFYITKFEDLTDIEKERIKDLEEDEHIIVSRFISGLPEPIKV